MQNSSSRATTDLIVSLLGLIAALCLGVVLLGQMWSYLPLFYATAFSMAALRILSSRIGIQFMAAPAGYVVSLPEGTLVFSAKMHRFQQRPLLEAPSVRVGWWQYKELGGEGGTRSYFVFFHSTVRLT